MVPNTDKFAEDLASTSLIGSNAKEEPFFRRNVSRIHGFFLKRFRDGDQVYLLILAVLIGVIMGFVSALFRVVINITHHFSSKPQTVNTQNSCLSQAM